MRNLWFCGAVVCWLAGCGGGGDTLKVPPLLAVSGKVTLDGQPLPSASVMFLPKPGTKGQGAAASTGEDGSFTLKYNNGEPGCPAGEYVVLISKLQTKDGKPIPAGQTAADADAVDIIPARYKDPDAPTNSISVTGAKSDLVFELKSK